MYYIKTKVCHFSNFKMVHNGTRSNCAVKQKYDTLDSEPTVIFGIYLPLIFTKQVSLGFSFFFIYNLSAISLSLSLLSPSSLFTHPFCLSYTMVLLPPPHVHGPVFAECNFKAMCSGEGWANPWCGRMRLLSPGLLHAWRV